ncbi:MAG: hypothetical protein AB8B53_06235 [Flavobacteriales bacterium]
MKKGEDKLVWAGYVILIVYNVIALTGVFENPLSEGFHKFYQDNFGTLTLLELVMVAGLFVNMIINYDSFQDQSRKFHLIITALVTVCFMLKLVFFFMGVFKQV